MANKNKVQLDENFLLKSKTLELNTFGDEQLKDENVEALNDEYSSNDFQDDNLSSGENRAGENSFKFYFDIIISVFLFFSSFSYYSYLNLFHILYSFYIICSKYSTDYDAFTKNRGYVAFFIIIMNLLNLLLKMVRDIYFNSTEKKILEFLFFYWDWRNIFEYVMGFINVFIILIYVIIKDFTEEGFKSELETNKIFLEKRIINNNNILNFGIFSICFGCTIYPTIFNFVLLLLGLVFFYSLILNKGCRRFFKKHVKYLYLSLIIFYVCYNYFLNSNLTKYKNFIGVILLFDEEKLTFFGHSTFLFFHLGFFLININIKCLQYIRDSQTGKFENTTTEYSNNTIERSFSHIDEDQEMPVKDIIDLRRISVTGTFSVSKEKTKMQAIFDTDIDCGIIAFSKLCKKKNIFEKIKLFLINFCYTPGFCLHACRLSAILWINCYMTYVSLLLIIWLLFSIKYSTSKLFLLGTKYIIYPLLIIIFLLSYISNIFKISQRFELLNQRKISKFLGLDEDETLSKKAFHMAIKIIIITIFQMFIHLKTKHSHNLRDSEIKDEVKKQQRELEKKIDQDFKGRYVIKPLEIFFKLYFLLLDILVIIYFYISISQTINILNELVLLSVIALFLMGKKFMGHLYIFLFILNISFLFKYLIYFDYNSSNTKQKSTNTRLLLSLLFNDNLYKIHYYWIAFYLLFLEYIGQTSKLFKLCKSKHFSIYEIIEYNFSSHLYIKFIFNTMFNFIFGIYIWLLIPCFIYCLLLMDNNCIALFHLLIVFIIYYKYIKIVGIKFNKLSGIFTFTRILIVSNVFNLIMMYVIQFLNKPPISIWYALSAASKKRNLELFGLFLFDGEYTVNLLPYFVMFALSIALHIEISRQIKMNTKDAMIKSEVEKYSLINEINTIESIVGDEYDEKTEALLSEDELAAKKKKDKYTNSMSREDKEERLEKLRKKLEENKKTKYIVDKLFIILYYILHYYWIIIFIFVAALSLHWMLSVSMVIQLTIFCYYMRKSFKGYYLCLERQSKNINPQKLSEKMKLYEKEKKEHFRITSDTQHSYFNLIWIFTFLFIIFSYLCCIIIKYCTILYSNKDLFSCTTTDNNIEKEKFRRFVGVMYFFGFYSAPQDGSTNTNFWSYTWGYFLTILLFSIRAYFLSKFSEIRLMYFNDQKIENRLRRGYTKVTRQSKFLEIHEIEKVQELSKEVNSPSDDVENYDNIKLDVNDYIDGFDYSGGGILDRATSYDSNMMMFNFKHENLNNTNNNDEFENLFLHKEKEEHTTKKEDLKETSDAVDNNEKKEGKRFIEKFFRREYIEYIREKKKQKNSQDDSSISYIKNIINKNLQYGISMQIGIKKFMELLIIFFIFMNALIKCNILSFGILFLLLFTYRQKNFKTHLMFKISNVILILLILQYMLYASNLSYLTNTYIDNEIISCVKDNIHIPWSNHLPFSYRWITFLSLGTNRYQVVALWSDVIIVLMLYFYLEYYSFSLYKEDEKSHELKIIYKKYNEKFKKLKSISKEEYKSFIRAMKVSYDIELESSNKNKVEININKIKKYNKNLLRLSYMFNKDKRFLRVNKTIKIKGYVKLRSFIYISFHYLLLLSTLLISSINQGFIGLGYMSFAIFYIYKSHCFLKGRRWTLLYGINYFMKPYLFLDILMQFIFQIPFNIYIKNNEKLSKFFDLFGFVQLADYSSNKNFLYPRAFFLVSLKIISYFLFLIQENIYLTYDFKKFILKYHYEYLQKAYIKGKLHSFLFNNYRVKLMKDRLTERKNIRQSLFNIQNTVNNWNISLTSYSSNDKNEDTKNMHEIPINHTSLSKKDKGITISKILRKHWLVSLTLGIFEDSRSIDEKHYNIRGEIMKILQGNIVLYSYLVSLIEDFEKKNYEKYCDIRNLKTLLEEKRKKNQKINNAKDEGISKQNALTDDEDELKLPHRRKNTVNLRPSFNFLKNRSKSPSGDLLNDSEASNSKSSLENLNIDNVREESEQNDAIKKKNTLGKKTHSSVTYDQINIPNSSFEDSSNNSSINNIDNSHNFETNNFDNKNIIEEEQEDFFLKDNDENKKNTFFKNNKKEYAVASKGNKYIKLDQPYDDMFFAHADYRDLKNLIREDFFSTYCSRGKVFYLLIKNIFNYFEENFQYIVYFTLLLNHLINSSITSLFYPFFIFLFGIVQYPRPSKIFWKILLVYTAFLIFFKFLIQLNIWEEINEFNSVFNYIENNSISFISNLGFKRVNHDNFFSFLNYVVPDFIVLIILIIYQFLLIRKGLWYLTETDYETVEESNDRIIKFNSKKYTELYGDGKENDIDSHRTLTSNEIISLIGKIKVPKTKGLIQTLNHLYQVNFPRNRNEKPGQDFYMQYTVFLIFILLYIIFFYTQMEQDKMVYNVDALKLKQFSGNMVIFAFIHVFLLVLDRYLYLKNARKLQKISFKVYDKIKGEDITINFKKFKYEDAMNETSKDNNKYEVVAYQQEDCQIGLLLKYATQVFVVIFIHLFIYFYLPSVTYSNQQDLNQNVNKISENIYILIFYILYLFYFLFSGLQIKYGLTDMKHLSSLMKASNLFYSLTYKAYKEIPFLFELKNFIDWTFTNTALDLWKWLKLEEIISLLYINKCYGKAEMHRRVGTKSPVYMKILMGGSTFFIVIIIIFGPLLLFSSLNPINMENPVIGVNLKIILSIPTNYSQKLNLTLFETSNSYIDNFDNEKEYQDYIDKLNNSDISLYKKSYKYYQVQKITVIGFTEHNWDISTKFIKYLRNLNGSNDYDLHIKYTFLTEHGTSLSEYAIESQSNINEEMIIGFKNLLSGVDTHDNQAELTLNDFYSPYQRVQSDNSVLPLGKTKKNLCLTLNKIGDDFNLYNWYIYNDKIKSSDKKNEEGIEFLTFSDLYSYATFGYDVLTFYVTFVIVAGKLIRAVFLGSAERIMYIQMVNPNRLFALCEGIKISRIRNDYLQEEKLYYLLIDLMRSPEIIKNMTQSSLIYIQDNNIVKETVKLKEFEVDSAPIIRKKKILKYHL